MPIYNISNYDYSFSFVCLPKAPYRHPPIKQLKPNDRERADGQNADNGEEKYHITYYGHVWLLVNPYWFRDEDSNLDSECQRLASCR